MKNTVKDSLRNQFKKKLIHFSTSPDHHTFSKLIATQIHAYLIHSSYQKILCFYPLPSEVNLIPLYHLLLKQSYPLYFPLIHKHRMEFYQVNSLNLLKKSLFYFFHIPPRLLDKALALDKVTKTTTIALIPGITFNHKGYRIGFGKGFYDQFLSRCSVHKLGIAFSFQQIEIDYQDTWDIPVQILITEKETANFPN